VQRGGLTVDIEYSVGWEFVAVCADGERATWLDLEGSEILYKDGRGGATRVQHGQRKKPWLGAAAAHSFKIGVIL